MNLSLVECVCVCVWHRWAAVHSAADDSDHDCEVGGRQHVQARHLRRAHPPQRLPLPGQQAGEHLAAEPLRRRHHEATAQRPPSTGQCCLQLDNIPHPLTVG